MAADWAVQKRQTEAAVKEIETLHSQWQTASENEAKRLHSRLLQDVGDVRWDLDDMEKSAVAVKASPDRSKVSLPEFETRQAFISQTRQKLNMIQNALSLRAPGRVKASTAGGTGVSLGPEGSDLHAAQRADQAQILKEQDIVLDRFHDTVTQIGTMSKHIGGELEEQNQILEEFDYEVQDTQGRLSTATKYIDKLMENISNNKSWCVIILLFVALVIVIILAWAL